MIEKYSDTFQYCETVQQVRDAIHNGKVASLLGVEGAHQLGNSLAGEFDLVEEVVNNQKSPSPDLLLFRFFNRHLR